MRIGLTGGIGSGKSTVGRLLEARGAALIDTDAIARELTLPGGPALPMLRAAFGAGLFDADGALDRARLREQVFRDPDAKVRLEAILHPMIRQVTAQRAAAAAGRFVVFDVPLLAESGGWRRRVERVLVVDCSEATQAGRVAERPGWSIEIAQRVIAQQASRSTRRAIADAVIFNDGIGLDRLETQVHALWLAWANPPAARANGPV